MEWRSMFDCEYRNKSVCTFVVWVVLLLIAPVLHAEELIRVTVLNEKGEPLQGVHLVLVPSRVLLTTTDADGTCLIDPAVLSCSDTIRFSYVGFEPSILRIDPEKNIYRIVLREIPFLLEEVAVRPLSLGEILKRAKKQVIPKKKAQEYIYYGKGNYEKVTECYGKTVEYRREYGVFFISGSKHDYWHLKAQYIPAYVRRSFNLTPKGMDTLKNVRVHFWEKEKQKLRYNAGERKLLTLNQVVMNYGPIFSDLKHYDLKPADMEGDEYVFRFKTNPKSYLRSNPYFCYGTLYIDSHSLRLTRIRYEYIDYHLFNLGHNGKKHYGKAHAPFATTAELSFAYDNKGECYVRSCTMVTEWKHNPDNRYYAIEHASRGEAGICQLVEKESFLCDEIHPVPEKYYAKGVSSLAKMISYGTVNPQGRNRADIFDQQPVLLDTVKPFLELSRYADVHKQFDATNGKPYYGKDYLSGWASPNEKIDEQFFRRFSDPRALLLSLFFFNKP